MRVMKLPEETEKGATDETMEDDLHLNRSHAKKLAMEMTKTVKSYRTRDDATEDKVQGKEEDLREIMGREGRNIRDIERDHRVKIYTSVRDPTSIRVSGSKSSVKKAKEILDKKVEELEARRRTNSERRDERKKIPCKFYAEKRCHKGDRCHYKHGLEIPRRGEYQERSRSQSGDRRRVIVRRRADSNE